MVAHVATVAFLGLKARAMEVQVQIAPGLPNYVAVGELKLDGRLTPSPGVLLAAMHASARDLGLICPARANVHATFPARVQLVGAMNPCRCGHLGDPALACSRATRCAADYQTKVSGPLLDRIDLHVEVSAESAAELVLSAPAEGSTEVAARIAAAREVQT